MIEQIKEATNNLYLFVDEHSKTDFFDQVEKEIKEGNVDLGNKDKVTEVADRVASQKNIPFQAK